MKGWYLLSNLSNGNLKIDINGIIGCNDISVEQFKNELLQYEGSNLDIYFHCEGGSVFEGLAFYNAIKLHKGVVTGVVCSLAASIASYVLMACDVIKITENGKIMIHEPTMPAGSSISEIESDLELLRKALNTIAKAYSDKTKHPIEYYLGIMNKGDKWFDANEAFELGLVDEIIKDDELKSNYSLTNSFKNDREKEIKNLFELASGGYHLTPNTPLFKLMTQCLNDKNCSVEDARELCLSSLGQASFNGSFNYNQYDKNTLTNTIIRGGSMNNIGALVNALGARVGSVNLINGNPFKNKSLLDIASICVGRDAHLLGKKELVARAMNTSDFPQVIGDTIQLVINEEIKLREPLFKRIANIVNLPDFKPTDLITVNDMPDLLSLSEDGEYKQAVISSTGEKIQLASFGREIRITRQAIINDNIDLLGKVPRKMIQAAFRLADKLMFNAMLSGELSDGAIFNKTNSKSDIAKGDYQSLVLDCYKFIAKQKTKEGSPLSLTADVLLANIDHGSMLEAVINTASKPDSFNAAYKKFKTVISTEYLADLDGAIGLSARDFESITMGFLDGDSNPMLEVGDGWSSDGATFRITYDLSAKVVDRRGLSKATFK